MRLTVNGEMREAPLGATVADLLASLGIEGRRVAVERNREIGLPGCLRVTAGTEAETTAFLEAMAAFTPARSATA